MKKKLLFGLLMVTSALTFLTGCAQKSSSEETITLRFAYASNSQPVIDSMKKFGELVNEKTDGKVVVEYYPDGQLGGETELIELTQTGGIDFTKVSASALEGFSKSYSVFGLPYLFDNEDHYFTVMENKAIMDPIYQSTKELGFVGLTYYDSGQRSFYMVDGPIESVADLKGKKIRTMQSATAIRMVSLLGGAAVPMSSSEVYTSLQSNLINGAENNEFVLYTAGHGGVAKYYSYDEHTRVPDIVLMSNSVKERLNEKQYQAVLEAAKASTEFEKTVFKDAVEAEKEIAIKEYGVKFNTIADTSEFRKAVQPMLDEYAANPTYGPIYQSIRDLAMEVKHDSN
ncbi:TRAP transporter substrate-binding protein [Streptococcus merionis]|uniref:Extracytoplasmic solute receptor protein yiaO n=1 Tax=Streptococcus merionis TaxID=400065 RepID=A0A239SPD7_9STRE|nr:Extracytoplasmic solute receptor protein yiaO [Streptococcus merionis]